jgi:hypothetical protein
MNQSLAEALGLAAIQMLSIVVVEVVISVVVWAAVSGFGAAGSPRFLLGQ